MKFVSVAVRLIQSIQEATKIAEDLLIHWVYSSSFTEVVQTSFGTEFNPQTLSDIQQSWMQGDFSQIPKVEIHFRPELDNADGAFSKSTGKIYLAYEYLIQHQQNPLAIASILLEEIGYWIDAEINLEETPGNVGAIFSALVRGKHLSEQQLLQLRTENDTAIAQIDSQVMELEKVIS